VLTDLQNRGIQDILITSVDGLKSFPEAIKSVFSDTEVQLCIVHQIRNSIKYVASKNQKVFVGELKTIYQVFTKDEAEAALDKMDGGLSQGAYASTQRASSIGLRNISPSITLSCLFSGG